MSKQLTPDIPRTVDLRPAANLFQGAAILLLGSVGAMFGHRAAADHPWAGAAVGAVAGVLVATFFSGLALIVLPPHARFISKDQSIVKYKALRRRLQRIAWAGLILAIAAAAGSTPFFAPPAAWAISLWLIAFCVCYGLLLYYSRLLDLWQCPGCGQLFGRRGAFTRYPHVCAGCKFMVDND